MAFTPVSVLSTSEQVRGNRLVGQVVPVVGGRIDKVSVYLEPSVGASTSALSLVVGVYALDTNGLPTQQIASASMPLSDIAIRTFYNFAIQCYTPPQAAIVLQVPGGTVDEYVAWRYVDKPQTSDAMLVSGDGGATWTTDLTKKLAYAIYSYSPSVNFDTSTKFGSLTGDPPSNAADQSATVQAAQLATVSDTDAADFELATLRRTAINGDTVVVAFSDFLVTLVVDMSGSMTWNDNNNVRFDFLKSFIDDLEASLASIQPTPPQASYSIVKFNSRQVGRMRLLLQTTAAANAISGVQLVRKPGAVPVMSPTDGIVVFDGLAEQFLDENLTTGTTYSYGLFTYDASGNFSDGVLASATPAFQTKPPLGVGGFNGSEIVVKKNGYDIGKRIIELTWSTPYINDATLQYTSLTIVRRDDRNPVSPADGTVVFTASSTDPGFNGGPVYDFKDYVTTPVFNQSAYPTAGLTYYYRAFTQNSAGIVCALSNAAAAEITVSEANRFWEQAEGPPLNDPTYYGFDPTPPASPGTPSVLVGDSELQIQWTAGAGDSRFAIYFKTDTYAQMLSDTVYNVTAVYDGAGTSFTHRGLQNGQPNYYTLVAYDNVGNQTAPINFTATTMAGLVSTIPPDPPNDFSAQAYNVTTNMLTWTLPLSDPGEINGWFGDTIQATAIVTYADSNPRTTLATLSFVQTERGACPIVATSCGGLTGAELANPPAYTPPNISPFVASTFSNAPSNDTSITALFSATPLISILAQLQYVDIRFHALLSVNDSSTGALLAGIQTTDVSITLTNPFTMTISGNPAPIVNIQQWDGTCNNSGSPMLNINPATGVYILSGQTIPFVIEASFKGEALEQNINVMFEILDAATMLPTNVLTLPQTNSAGVAVLTTETQTDAVLDSNGNPTGMTTPSTKLYGELPAQNTPGMFILQATGSYLGYTRVATMAVRYEPPLNIDMNLMPFNGDGINIAEQSCFVYLGDPTLPALKSPVTDFTVVEWTIAAVDSVSRQALPHRPFYSTDNVSGSGSGVRSYTRGGTARKVFFGPGTDIGPQTQSDAQEQDATSCVSDGEGYEISATAKYQGMTFTGTGFIALKGYDQQVGVYNNIFLRHVGGFNTDIIYADGTAQSAWEVVAIPETDGDPNDESSGAFFRNAVTGLGGQVPDLPDGTVVSLYASPYQGQPTGSIMISSNLTNGSYRAAKALVQNGRAIFYLTLNSIVSGLVLQPSLTEPPNLIYGQDATWDPSALIFSLTALVPIRINGVLTAFSGGGSNLISSFPPCFLSFNEPLTPGNGGQNTQGGAP